MTGRVEGECGRRSARRPPVLRLWSCFAVFVVASSVASAQMIAVGAGLAVPASDVGQLPAEVRDAGWQAVGDRAATGYYLEARIRLGDELAMTGGIAYNRFLEHTSRFRDPNGSEIELLTSQVVVPVTIGIERRFGSGILAPYAALEASASYFYRAFESMKGSTPVPVELQSDGAMRFGGAVAAGLSLDLAVLRLDLGGRFHLVNLVGPASTTESIGSFLQLGMLAYFGL